MYFVAKKMLAISSSHGMQIRNAAMMECFNFEILGKPDLEVLAFSKFKFLERDDLVNWFRHIREVNPKWFFKMFDAKKYSSMGITPRAYGFVDFKLLKQIKYPTRRHVATYSKILMNKSLYNKKTQNMYFLRLREKIYEMDLPRVLRIIIIKYI